MTGNYVNLQDAVSVHQALLEHRNAAYINLVQQINTRSAAVIKDDMGSQFLQNCGRDLAGEVVRNFFDTSDYNITVDQLAMRILKFSYEDEYDPLAENGSSELVRKNVYNYNELHSDELDKISATLDASQEKLFTKPENSKYYEDQYFIDKRKREYRANNRAESGSGVGFDETTGKAEGYKERSDGQWHSDLDVDHVLDLDGATYDPSRTTEKGKQLLKDFYNSDDNFSMRSDSANRSKGAVKVYEKNGKILSPKDVEKEKESIAKELLQKNGGQPPKDKDINDEFEKRTSDATHKATPEQLSEALFYKWENAEDKQKLIDAGYLNEDGTVPKSVRHKELEKIRHSQNKESVARLKGRKFSEDAKEAAKHTKAAVGKIIAGQIIYYAAPPLVYEVRTIIQNRQTNLDSTLDQLGKAALRIGDYVFSKIKDIFSNVLFSSLKKFIKSFMDILIGAVKATVKKLLKIAKNLVLSTVDAVRIIADKNASPAEKADSVFSLFGVTITSCVIEVLFELAADALHIPEPFDEIIFGPLQILTTVVCTNLTMLILQKADLFDVRFGFKINAIKNIFAEEYEAYAQEMAIAEDMAELEVQKLLERARADCLSIYNSLEEMDLTKGSARPQLDQIGRMFNVYIDFDAKWEKFLGKTSLNRVVIQKGVDPELGFVVDFTENADEGIAAIILYYYFVKQDSALEKIYPFDRFILPQSAMKEIANIRTLNPLLFSEVRKRLDKVSDDALASLKSMAAMFMSAGAGDTAAKSSAKARFDKYAEVRGV